MRGYGGAPFFLLGLRGGAILSGMPEFPDANSGGLDPMGAPTAKCQLPLWRRVRAWAVICALYAALLGMAAASIWPLRFALRSGVALDDRLMHLLWAGGLLTPLGFVVRYFVRVRLKTGTWRGTAEQRKQEREQRLARCSGGGAKIGCANNRNDMFAYVVKWASYAAFHPKCTIAQRCAAWTVLVAYGLVVACVAGLGVICFGAAFADDNTHTQSALFLALGVAVLVWPCLVVWRLIRGLRAGQVGTTREELDGLRARRTAWHVRENQKPLRTKLLTTAFSVVIYGLWWFRVTVHHAQHPHESWVTPAMFTPALIYSIWVQFRGPKNVPPADGDGGQGTQAQG